MIHMEMTQKRSLTLLPNHENVQGKELGKTKCKSLIIISLFSAPFH